MRFISLMEYDALSDSEREYVHEHEDEFTTRIAPREDIDDDDYDPQAVFDL